jgi:hypothetical protein
MRARKKKGEKFFVHRYRWSHSELRRLAKRMIRTKYVKVLEWKRDGMLCQYIQDEPSRKELERAHKIFMQTLNGIEITEVIVDEAKYLTEYFAEFKETV